MTASKAAPDLPDYYQLLEVSPQASIEVIRAAYRAIAKKLHPDKGGSHGSILGLNAAYEVLCDLSRRRDYDQTREFKKEAQVVERTIIVVCCLSCGKENRVAELARISKERCKGCGEAFQRKPGPGKKNTGFAAVFCFHCGTKNYLELEEPQGLTPFSSALLQASCSNCGFPFRDHVR